MSAQNVCGMSSWHGVKTCSTRSTRSWLNKRAEQTQLREESVADVEDLSLRDSTGQQQLSILEGRNRTRLQLDAALQRLDEGTYGLCEDCLQPINEKRLEAVPFAVRCIECQRHAEQLEAIEKKEDRDDL